MIALLLLGGLGLVSVPLWPSSWRLGLALGWTLAWLLELLLLARCSVLLRRPDARLVALQVFSFLAKLAILLAGGLLGAVGGLYHTAAFLVGFATGAFLLHLFSLRASLRAARPRAKIPHPSSRAPT